MGGRGGARQATTPKRSTFRESLGPFGTRNVSLTDSIRISWGIRFE